MLTNKMLLTQKKDDGDKIPYKPFPPGEQKKNLYYDDESIKILTEGGEVPFLPDTTGFVFTLPENNCTVLLGITDEKYSELKGSGIVRTMEAFFDIGPVDFYEDNGVNIADYKNVIAFQSEVGTDDWKQSCKEKYVRIKFEDNSNTVLTSLSAGPLIGGGTTPNGEEICAYPNFYIKTSNEIHEHGPDIEDGSPLVITIKKSL